MLRVLAVIGGLVAVVLFAIYASDMAAHPSLLGWGGLVAFAAGFVALALDGLPLGTWGRGGAA